MTTNQEVFERVYAYAKTVTKAAINDEGTCLYRSPVGPCLIGSLIKDEFYSEGLEGSHATTNVVLEALRKSGINLEDEGFLLAIQCAHDEVVMGGSEGDELNPELISNLKAVADKYKLEIPA